MVAMANEGRPDTNGSQFFITLSECNWLNKKHTIFGKVCGKTMFNVLEMANAETGEADRPLHPPKIESVEVLLNPFDDIRPRKKNGTKDAAAKKTGAAMEKSVRKQAGSASKTLLSFDDSDEEQIARPLKKFSSCHEALKKQREDPSTATAFAEMASKTALRPKQFSASSGGAGEASDAQKVGAKDGSRKPEQAADGKESREMEYKKLKNSLIRRKKELATKNFALLEGLKKARKKDRPPTLLEKRNQRYRRRGVVNKKQREENTMDSVKTFSRNMHKMAEAFRKKRAALPAELASSEESVDDQDWFRDGVLDFKKIPSHLDDFMLEDYVIKDPAAGK